MAVVTKLPIFMLCDFLSFLHGWKVPGGRSEVGGPMWEVRGGRSEVWPL